MRSAGSPGSGGPAAGCYATAEYGDQFKAFEIGSHGQVIGLASPTGPVSIQGRVQGVDGEGERMRLQLDTLVSDTKKNVQKVGEATRIGGGAKQK